MPQPEIRQSDRTIDSDKSKPNNSLRKVFPIASAEFTLAMIIVLLFHTSAMFAQGVANGSVTGRVTDPLGAVVIGADLTLTQTDTGLVEHTVTNKDGIYRFPSQQPGPYQVKVTRSGFKTEEAAITLTVNETATLDLELSVGRNSESVTVQSENSAQLETQSSNLDFTVGTKQVVDLPLNGRNPYGLAALSPGINSGSGFGEALSTARAAAVVTNVNNFESNGGFGGNNEVLLDGLPTVVCCQGQPPATPSAEVVDQFKVITSNPTAQYGRSSGGILNIVTKSGTNALRGDIYEFLRNDQLDAANYFTKRSGVYPIPSRHDFRPPHKYNLFGGFVGGPVRIPKLYNGMDKTFFTFGYEGTRNVTSSFATDTVPTLLMRQGIFTEAPAPIYSPTLVTQPTPGTFIRQPIPAATCNGTAYPAGYCVPNIDAVAAATLKFFPAPNVAGVVNNYVFSPGVTDQENQINFRIDHNFSPSQRTFARLTRDWTNHLQNGLFNETNGTNTAHQTTTSYLFALGHTWTLSPRNLLQFTYGFAYQTNRSVPGNMVPGAYNAANYGFSQNLVSEQQAGGLPNISISNFPEIGNVNNDNALTHYSHTVGVTAILLRGNHTLTTGWDGRLIIEEEQSLGNPTGTVNFDTTFTNGPNTSSSVPSGQAPFDAWAAFQIGTPTSPSLQRQLTLLFHQPYNAFYLQDDWRVSPRLTLNLGLRFDIEEGAKELNNHFADIDLSATNPLAAATGLNFTGGAQFLGVPGNPSRTWKTTYDFGPRIGLAYSATGRTVVRGGYGILYLPTSQRIYLGGNIGFQQSTVFTSSVNALPTTATENPLPNGVLLPVGASAGVTAGSGTQQYAAVVHNLPTPYQQQWNLGVQQEVRQNLTFNIGYVAGHGVKLPFDARLNDLQPQYFSTPGDAAQVAYLNTSVPNPFAGQPAVAGTSLNNATVPRKYLLAKYPQYITNSGVANGGIVVESASAGNATYNSLQAGLSYRRTGGLSGDVFYTWSKLLGNVSDLTNTFLSNNNDPTYQDYYFLHQLEHSLLQSDAPQRVFGNVIYPLPFGRGQRFANDASRWLDLAIGGWQLNSIAAIQSGYPLGITQGNGAAFSGGRPMKVTGVSPATSGSTHHRLGNPTYGQSQGYLNPAAFTLAQSFQLGNVPRQWGAVRTPLGFQNDIGLIKNFGITEVIRLQFRLEAFNFINKVQFNSPNTAFNTSTFGYITSQANSPRNVQLALKLYF